MKDRSTSRRARSLALQAASAALVLAASALLGCRAETSPQGEPAATTAAPSPARPAPQAAKGAETWNAAQIDWQPYADGLERAKAENKPICLVFYTTWCPHCKNYSKVFDDPRVVESAKHFVMIRVDADQEGEVAKKFTKDGGYIPRTFFLASDGTPDFDIHAPRPKYAYFYDEREPRSLLGGMSEALGKLQSSR